MPEVVFTLIYRGSASAIMTITTKASITTLASDIMTDIAPITTNGITTGIIVTTLNVDITIRILTDTLIDRMTAMMIGTIMINPIIEATDKVTSFAQTQGIPDIVSNAAIVIPTRTTITASSYD